jgi:hypothetical protein
MCSRRIIVRILPMRLRGGGGGEVDLEDWIPRVRLEDMRLGHVDIVFTPTPHYFTLICFCFQNQSSYKLSKTR